MRAALKSAYHQFITHKTAQYNKHRMNVEKECAAASQQKSSSQTAHKVLL